MKKFMRWGWRAVKGFLDNHCSIHAAGLTYFSLLAIVPIVCVILVGAKACGADEYAKREINNHLDAMISTFEHGQEDELLDKLPVDEKDREQKKIAAYVFAKQAREISNTLFERVSGFNVRTFGWIGFALLVWTVISSIGMVEVSFNEIWRVPKPRPIWKRAYINLSLVIALPLFATLALSPQLLNIAKDILIRTLGAAWLTKWVSDGLVWFIDWWVFRFTVSFAVSSCIFAFVFWLLPNCKVRFSHSWYGGAMTAILFGAWLKACAVAQIGISKTSAMYGSFAFLPIVLAWIYMSWQIVLFGANMVHAFAPEADGK